MIFHRDLREVRAILEMEKWEVKIRIDAICALDAGRSRQTALKTARIPAIARGRSESGHKNKAVPFPEAADKIHVASPRTRYNHPEKLRSRVNTLDESSQHRSSQRHKLHDFLEVCIPVQNPEITFSTAALLP
jgi:hypothetical protein